MLRLPLPSLISLKFVLDSEDNIRGCQDFLNSFLVLAPNIRKLRINLQRPNVAFNDFVSSYICRWQNLEDVLCPDISLNVDALVHLSYMLALTRLDIMADTTFAPFDSPLIFSNLHHLKLQSPSFPSVSSLLLRTRLPTITDFTVMVFNGFSRQGFSSFLTSVQTSDAGRTIENLAFYTSEPLEDSEDALFRIGLEDLRSCMAFTNLRCIDLDFWRYGVGLTEVELLELASAWPRLEEFKINKEWGWHTRSGITPNGLLQLLQACRSLSQIALVIDTRGYTEFSQSPASLGLTLSRTFSIDVLDSIIEAESVPAIAAYFTSIALCSKISLYYWQTEEMMLMEPLDCIVYEERWNDVYRIVKDAAIGQHS